MESVMISSWCADNNWNAAKMNGMEAGRGMATNLLAFSGLDVLW
jgi:hypothetical protein